MHWLMQSKIWVALVLVKYEMPFWVDASTKFSNGKDKRENF